MKIAGVQCDIRIGDVESNLSNMSKFYQEARSNGAELVVFPECSVAGYCFDSFKEALVYAEDIPGPSTSKIQEMCHAFGGSAVVGLLENAENGGVFNSLVLIGSEGVLASYRKIHLPYLGVDRFTSYGDKEFSVVSMGGVNIGLNICYDAGFPEVARILTLLGAELIVLSTNWPPPAKCIAENVIRTRAMENGVYYIAVNRVGSENGNQFIGASSICSPNGDVLALAGPDEEVVLYADIDPLKASNKLRVHEGADHMTNRIADRRPEMYSKIVEHHSLKSPGRD
tara:strand:- start:423 stop:1274 length:852 start_codon:yes stop_codon:yes gene_type:complete